MQKIKINIQLILIIILKFFILFYELERREKL